MRFICLIFAVACQCLMAFGQASELSAFYRVSGPGTSISVSFTTNGILGWTGIAAQGSYVVERAKDPVGKEWAPWVRGVQTASNVFVKVQDFRTPSHMVFIPGGRFLMGDSQGDPQVVALATPVHPVQVSPFFMDRFEFTNERAREILQWAWDNQQIRIDANVIYTKNAATNRLVVLGKFNSEIIFRDGVFTIRAGRAPFPAQYITWFGSLALCNYQSAMHGLELSYNFTNWACDFNKRGYRLPTEAEWEIAARGGYEGLRFPWSHTNVITHSLANYRSDTNNWYDVSPTREYHPDYTNLRPRSSPVGLFAPNNYGLYDMAGNNWEWVWDFHARHLPSFQVDPTGPVAGSNRIFKGGSWFTKAERLTCAMRYPANPDTAFDDIGFRMILPYRP